MRTLLKRFSQISLAAAAIAVCSDLLSYVHPSVSLPTGAGGWSLAAAQDCAKPVPAQLQIWRGISGASRVCRGVYRGSPEMTLTIYDLPRWGAGAFDAWQKWQAQPGKMAFYKGRYFGVVESPGADMSTLDRFTTAIEGAGVARR
jgi:hypothetical protein